MQGFLFQSADAGKHTNNLMVCIDKLVKTQTLQPADALHDLTVRLKQSMRAPVNMSWGGITGLMSLSK
jgi:hypothetical protein